VSMAAHPALAPKPLSVLLVSQKEEDFYLIREILERTRTTLAADLDHAHSLAEAKAMLPQKTYGLVMFEHQTGDTQAVHFVAEFLHAGVSVPFILLTDDADEKTVAGIIQGGTLELRSEIAAGRSHSGAHHPEHAVGAFHATGAADCQALFAKAVARSRAVGRHDHDRRPSWDY
jgi:CheY-like chemotaxis protein